MGKKQSFLDGCIRFSLNNRLLVMGLAAFILVYGIFAIMHLPIDVFPDLNRPTVNIMTEAPGMAPEEVETRVTIPLEIALNGIPGVERIRSSSGIGLSVVYVEFHWGTDLYRNRQLVSEKISLAKDKIPKSINPVMGPIASIMGEIQLLGLSSENNQVSPIDLRTLADWSIRPRLLAIPGVAQVIAIGGQVRQYQIMISAEKLQRFQLSLEDVEHNLAHLSQNTTGGFLDIAAKENLIRTIGAVKTKEEILESVVGIHFGKPVVVADIAEVREGGQIKRGDGSVNGKPAVILSIQKQPGSNTIELTEKIDRVLKELKKDFPAGVILEKELFKQAYFIERAVDNVKIALRDGTILVFIVLFLFLLNFRTTAITLTAIPLSLVLTALIFKFFDISVNTMTLGGLAVAIGELVDDAIVDVENVFRRLAENKRLPNPKPALGVIYRASSEVRNSIVFATVIVILVFIPLFYLDGIEGKLFVPLGIAYIVSIISSLIVSLTVTPVLCAFLLPKSKAIFMKEGKIVYFLKKMNRRILNYSLDNPRKILTVSLLVFGLSLASIPMMGKDFLPKFNEGTAVIGLLAEPGISLDASNKLGEMAENLILSVPEVKSVARRTGRAEMDEHAEGVHSSEIDVDFVDGGRRREIVLQDIRDKLSQIKGVYVNIGQPISHRLDHLLSGVRAQIAIKLFGSDLPTLRARAQEIHRSIQGIDGLVDLQVEQQVLVPQVKIQLLRQEAAKYGIVLGDLAANIETALKGEVVAEILEGQRNIAVYMRFDDKSRADLDLIKKTTIKILPNGTRLPLESVADIFESTGPNIINRENSGRRIVIQANASGRDLDYIVKEIKAKISKDVILPSGYFIELGGQFESQQRATRLILVLGFFSLLGIFFVLYGHFKTAFIPMQIMLNIPMALIGSVIAVLLSGRIFSVATLVAFITLCGIASRNGIMMISHYLHLMKEEGETFTREMVIRGSLERLVPVLMTALTAILGLLPLVLSSGEPGKELLHPMAVVIVGGLISSTLLDMLVTPTVFFHFGKKSALKSINPDQGDHV